MTQLDIRPMVASDISELAKVADAVGLFPGEALASMASPA